jgi:hypothetical protein
VKELPAPGTDPTDIANRKILGDALTMATAEIAALGVTVAASRREVEAALAGTGGESAVRAGCTKLEGAVKQTNDKLVSTLPAIQLYQKMVAKP